MKPYFYVYRETTLDGKPPTTRHATLELAQAEAERLAVKHTGSVIQILKCVGISQVTGPASTFFMDGEGPRIEEVKKQLSELASCVSGF
jgi:hypothetical protein